MAEEEGKNPMEWPKEATEASDFDFMMVGKDGNPIMKVKKQKLNEIIVVQGESMPAIQGGATSAAAVALPAGPTGQNRWFDASWGYWKYNSVVLKNPLGTDGIPQGSDGTLYWDGTALTWKISKMQELKEATADGKVAAGDSKAVNGNEVFKKSLTKEIYVDGNDFDPSARITNSYINNNTGLITNTGEEKYVISIIYPCVEGDNIYFSNWDRNSSFCVRFLNNSNSPLKPLKSDGTQFSIYSDTFIGPIKAPVGAVGYQYTLVFNNYGNQSNLVVNKTGVTKESIKNKFINANAKVVESDTNPLSGDTAAKQLIKKDYLIVGANWYDYTKDIEKFYINTTTGLLAAEDKSAISQILDVNAVGKVIVQNRLGNGAYRFLSAGNVPMKALDKDGVEFPSFAGPLNGEFYKPVGAVGFQFTSKFIDVTNRTNTVVNQDGYLTAQVKKEFIPVDTNGKMWISKFGNNVSVNGINSNGAIITTNMTFRSGANTQSNPNFNLVSDYVGGILFKDSSDDVAPVNLFNNSYIGANHGWNYARTIGLAGHGKTVADIGSVYTDSLNREYVIVNIIDSSNFILCSRNLATDGYSYTFPATTDPLTYKSNGANTSNIPSGYTATPLNNLYNFVKLNVSKLLVDGNEISTDGNIYGNTIQVVEDYDVFDLDSVLSQLISNRPTGGYTNAPNLNSFNAIKLFNHSLVYEWKKAGKCLIIPSFISYKRLAFNFHGFIQSSALINASAKIYIPKGKPFGGVDYRLAPTYAAPVAPVHLTKTSYWEYPDNAPDRVMNFITGNYGIHLGYLNDLGDSVNRKSLVDDAIFLNTTKKLYPKGIDKIQVLEPGVSYSVIAFRNILDLTNVGSVRTALDFIRADNALYVTVDYHKQGLDIIEIPDDFLGKNIVILENRKAELYGKISNKFMKINSTADDYGFIKFKIK